MPPQILFPLKTFLWKIKLFFIIKNFIYIILIIYINFKLVIYIVQSTVTPTFYYYFHIYYGYLFFRLFCLFIYIFVTFWNILFHSLSSMFLFFLYVFLHIKKVPYSRHFSCILIFYISFLLHYFFILSPYIILFFPYIRRILFNVFYLSCQWGHF